MKTLKHVKMWRGSQNEDHESQSSLWFVTWRRLHNVQTKKASKHTEMSKNIASKPATGMQGYTMTEISILLHLKP